MKCPVCNIEMTKMGMSKSIFTCPQYRIFRPFLNLEGVAEFYQDCALEIDSDNELIFQQYEFPLSGKSYYWKAIFHSSEMIVLPWHKPDVCIKKLKLLTTFS